MTRRLYLDLADLYEIGDGRVQPDELRALVRAMSDTDTMLVLSRDHVHDAAGGGPSSLESLARAAEVFQPVLAVMDGPDEVEPLTCTNYREIVFSDAAERHIAIVGAAYDEMHQGEAAAHRIVAADAPPRIRTRSASQLGSQCYVSLCMGNIGDDPEVIVSFWELELPASVTPEEREAILVRLRGVAVALPAIRALATEHGLDITDALRMPGTWAADPTAWPGHQLAQQVHVGRHRDERRKPRRSDWPDVEHAKHFPYVDVATCDANTLTTVQRVLPTLTCPRRAVVLNNRRLDRVVAAVRAGGGQE